MNVWRLDETLTFADGVDPHTGRLIGRHDIPIGKRETVCPAVGDGAVTWISGSYDPDTGLYYKAVQEWCDVLEAQHLPKPPDYSGQVYLSATYSPIAPPGHRAAYGHINAVDPVSGKKAWEVVYKYPIMASLLSTKGGLLFVPRPDGMLAALDAKTGRKLWSHNDGIGHDGGIISYAVNGKQFIAVTTGWGHFEAQNLASLFGQPFIRMPTDAGALVVYSLPAFGTPRHQ